MSCAEFEQWIALEVEQDLPMEKQSQLGEHLRGCEACGTFAEELRLSQAALKAIHRAPLDERRLKSIRASVLAELRGLAKDRQPLIGWPALSWVRPVPALAAALLLLLAGSVLWQSGLWRSGLGRSGESERAGVVSVPAVEGVAPIAVTAAVAAAEPADAESPAAASPTATPAGVAETHPNAAERGEERLSDGEPRPARETVVSVGSPADSVRKPVARPEFEVVSVPNRGTDNPEGSDDFVLRVASDDPSITIYWLVGQNGD